MLKLLEHFKTKCDVIKTVWPKPSLSERIGLAHEKKAGTNVTFSKHFTMSINLFTKIFIFKRTRKP